MSIFRRIFKIGQATAHSAVERLETPERMLEQAIRDKAQQIRDAKKSVQSCIATERQARAMLDREQMQRKEWEAKAEAALRAGKEDLAVRALNRATEHEQKAATLEKNWESQREAVEALKRDIGKLEEELAEFKRNKDFILAQSRAADVKKSIYEAKAKISEKHDVDDLMARLKAKAERASYEADAAQELAEDQGDQLEREFAELGNTGAAAAPGVDDKLAALRAKIGQN